MTMKREPNVLGMDNVRLNNAGTDGESRPQYPDRPVQGAHKRRTGAHTAKNPTAFPSGYIMSSNTSSYYSYHDFMEYLSLTNYHNSYCQKNDVKIT